jgi:hypothetical protein
MEIKKELSAETLAQKSKELQPMIDKLINLSTEKINTLFKLKGSIDVECYRKANPELRKVYVLEKEEPVVLVKKRKLKYFKTQQDARRALDKLGYKSRIGCKLKVIKLKKEGEEKGKVVTCD